jgi:Fe-S-cluster-containing dehydrogenase component
MDLVICSGLCTACRACELACNYHHAKSFGTARSSLHVVYNPSSSELKVEIDKTCDSCAGQLRPSCVDACARDAIRLRPE